MKIAMLSDLYTPVIGGGERHVESLSRELSKRGHKVTVYTVASPGLSRYEELGDVKIYRMTGLFQRIPFLFKDARRKWHPPTGDWLITRQLRSMLERAKPDIVHAHGRILYSFLPLKEDSGLPLVASLHSYALFCPKTNLMKGNAICYEPFSRDCIACGKDFYGLLKSLFAYHGTRMNKGKLRMVDKFIAMSSFAKEACSRALALSDEDVIMIPNFYDAAQDGGSERAMNLPEDFILFVGALVPEKGIDVLIEAYQRLNTQTKLVVIGWTHPDYRYQSMENILVIQDAPHSDVMEAISRCRFTVFPSISPDLCPTVAFEAMSQKKAVIAADIGGLKDIVIDGETGVRVTPNDSGKLTEAMSYLLQRPGIASDMGEKGLEVFMQNYSADVVIPRIVRVYQSLA